MAMTFHHHSACDYRDGKALGAGDALVKQLYSPREVEHVLSISHAQLYRLLGAGKLVALKIGRGTYIPRESIEQFLAALPRAKVGEAA